MHDTWVSHNLFLFDDVGRTSELVAGCLREISAYRRGDASSEIYSVELLRRATVECNQEAQVSLQQCLTEVVRGWLRCHPSRETAIRLASEATYVALAFEQFWRAILQQQVACKTLAEVLTYLHASLQGVILETLRTSVRPGGAATSLPRESGKLYEKVPLDSREVWNRLLTILPDQREQRLAYLLYHYSLGPREIVRVYPQEWSNVQEIYRLRHAILEKVLRNSNKLKKRYGV